MSLSQPNVVLLTCHDLGRHLGVYGVPTVCTPSIDALGERSIICMNAFSVSCGCSPSRAALATGRYPHANGVMGLTHPPFNWSLGSQQRHMAGLLREVGYETALFGFQHVSVDETSLGFEHLFTDGTALSRELCPRIESFLTERSDERPLYLEVNLEEPHRPFDQGGAEPDARHGVFIPSFLPQDDASREEMAALQGAIRQADAAIGRILAAIDRFGLAEDTMVIFVADHGLPMPRAKGTLYDPGIEIACIIRLPGQANGGGKIGSLISNVDVLPTVLEALNLRIPARVQGRSFLANLQGKGGRHRDEIFAEKTYQSYGDPMRAIRTEAYKLILNFESAFDVEVPGDVQMGAIFRSHVERYHGRQHPPVELYDLSADPLELTNLTGERELKIIQTELTRRLLDWMEDTDDPLLGGAIPSPRYEELIREVIGSRGKDTKVGDAPRPRPRTAL